MFAALSYLGVFLATFVGSLVPFAPAFYLSALFLAASDSGLQPALLVVSSALGATLAKSLIFRASWLGGRFLRQRSKKSSGGLGKIASRYGWVGAFVAAATPIPDDLVYIPLGLMGYGFMKFLAAVFFGKVLFTSLVVAGGRTYGQTLMAALSIYNISWMSMALASALPLATITLLVLWWKRTNPVTWRPRG